MTLKKFDDLKDNIISELKSNLLPALYYHSAEHTLDVLNAAEKIPWNGDDAISSNSTEDRFQ